MCGRLLVPVLLFKTRRPRGDRTGLSCEGQRLHLPESLPAMRDHQGHDPASPDPCAPARHAVLAPARIQLGLLRPSPHPACRHLHTLASDSSTLPIPYSAVLPLAHARQAAPEVGRAWSHPARGDAGEAIDARGAELLASASLRCRCLAAVQGQASSVARLLTEPRSIAIQRVSG